MYNVKRTDRQLTLQRWFNSSKIGWKQFYIAASANKSVVMQTDYATKCADHPILPKQAMIPSAFNVTEAQFISSIHDNKPSWMGSVS